MKQVSTTSDCMDVGVLAKLRGFTKRFLTYSGLILAFAVNCGQVYPQFPQHFQQTAMFTSDSGRALCSVALDDGTVILAAQRGGLYALYPSGSSFDVIDHIDDGGEALFVDADPSGRTIAVANSSDGLRVYHYSYWAFESVAHVETDGYCVGVKIAPDGTIFTTYGDHGIRAFTLSSDTLAFLGEYDEGGYVKDTALGSNGTVFVAARYVGLIAYLFDGSSFTHLAWNHDYPVEQVEISPSGELFAASNYNGISTYSFSNNSIMLTANVNILNGDETKSVALGSDGTVFACGWNDGLRAFAYDGDTLVNVAHIDTSIAYPDHVMVGPDGTIYVSSAESFAAFTYSAYLGIDESQHAGPRSLLLRSNPNPFNPTTTISYDIPEQSAVNLTAYDVKGREIASLQNKEQPSGHHEVQWNGVDELGNPVSTGVYFARLQAGDFSKTIKMVLLR